MISFRDKVLRANRWDPGAGASLRTFFIGHVLMKFVDQAVSRMADLKRTGHTDSLSEIADLVDRRVDRSSGHHVDPESEAIARVSIERLLALIGDPDRQRIAFLDSLAFQNDEIGFVLGKSPKAIEMHLYRLRQKWRGEREKA